MPDPIEKTEELAAEAERGRSERTPWLVLGGVHIAVVALVGGRAGDRVHGLSARLTRTGRCQVAARTEELLHVWS